MQKYDISILHVIGDVNAYYSIAENGQLKLNFINDIHFKNLKADLSKLANKGGINVEHNVGIDLHTFIKKEIKRDRPVIAIADCFYLPYRSDTFERKHFFHPILLMGYDNTSYYIIDQINDESLTFGYRVIDSLALEEACTAYIKSCKQGYITGLTSYGYVAKNSLEEDIKRKTILYRKENINVILNGLEALIQFKEKFCVAAETGVLEAIVLVINDIINFLLVEKQKIIELGCESNVELLAANADTINIWVAIRREIYMCVLSTRRRSLETQDRIVNLIDKVYYGEKKYHLLFVD